MAQRQRPKPADKSLGLVVAALHTAGTAILGTSNTVLRRIRDYEAEATAPVAPPGDHAASDSMSPSKNTP